MKHKLAKTASLGLLLVAITGCSQNTTNTTAEYLKNQNENQLQKTITQEQPEKFNLTVKNTTNTTLTTTPTIYLKLDENGQDTENALILTTNQGQATQKPTTTNNTNQLPYSLPPISLKAGEEQTIPVTIQLRHSNAYKQGYTISPNQEGTNPTTIPATESGILNTDQEKMTANCTQNQKNCTFTWKWKKVPNTDMKNSNIWFVLSYGPILGSGKNQVGDLATPPPTINLYNGDTKLNTTTTYNKETHQYVTSAPTDLQTDTTIKAQVTLPNPGTQNTELGITQTPITDTSYKTTSTWKYNWATNKIYGYNPATSPAADQTTGLTP